MDNKLTIKVTKAKDIIELKDNLRADDVSELTALGSTPLNSLLEGYIFSDECYTTFVDNKIMGMFGFSKRLHTIWFLGNDLSLLVRRDWIRTARYYIRHFLEIEPILSNTVSTNNILHIKWLKRMGAKFSTPYLINNHYFQDFYIIKGE